MTQKTLVHFSSCLSFIGSCRGLIGSCERIGMNKTARTIDFSTPRSWDCAHIRWACLLSSIYCDFVFMAPIPPSRCRRYQFRANELHVLFGFSRDFSPSFCTELASCCRCSFGELSPGGTNGRVIAPQVPGNSS